MVQKITYESVIAPNTGGPAKKEKKVFWEAWLVKEGQDRETGDARFNGVTDTFEQSPHPGTHGKTTITGEVKFFLKGNARSAVSVLGMNGLTPLSQSIALFPGSFGIGDLGDPGAAVVVLAKKETGFRNFNPKTDAQHLPSTDVEPTWWKFPSHNNEPTSKRVLTVTWADPHPASQIAAIAGFSGVMRISPFLPFAEGTVAKLRP